MAPHSLEDYLFLKLMRSAAFHRFVRGIYYKVNGINPNQFQNHDGPRFPQTDTLFTPSIPQKFKAFRLIFYDEMRSSFGFQKKYNIK